MSTGPPASTSRAFTPPKSSLTTHQVSPASWENMFALRTSEEGLVHETRQA